MKIDFEAVWDALMLGDWASIPAEVKIKHYANLTAIVKDNPKPIDDLPEGTQTGVWIFGDTGTGKSHSIREKYPDCFMKDPYTKWWDGYKYQDTAYLEDFDKNASKHLGARLKNYADRYAFPAEIKRGAMKIRPRWIVVSSNWHPAEIWDDEPNVLQPLLRRFKIVHVRKFGQTISDTLHVDEVLPAYVGVPDHEVDLFLSEIQDVRSSVSFFNSIN